MVLTGTFNVSRPYLMPAGHGYAAKIMQEIIADAKEAGVHTLDLGAQVSALGSTKTARS